MPFFLLFTTVFSQSLEKGTILFLQEEIQLEVEGQKVDTYHRDIYIDKERVRTDIEKENLRLIYDMELNTLLVIELDKKRFFLARPGRDRRFSRLPLLGIATQEDGQLVKKSGALFTKTGAERTIVDWDCNEFSLTYPDKYGISTTIWSTPYYRFGNLKSRFKKLWYAALGTNPPKDVKLLLSRIIGELNGVPIRTISTISQEGIKIKITSTFTSIITEHHRDPSFFEIPGNFKFVQEDVADRPWFDY